MIKLPIETKTHGIALTIGIILGAIIGNVFPSGSLLWIVQIPLLFAVIALYIFIPTEEDGD